jgi:hypothetical protein
MRILAAIYLLLLASLAISGPYSYECKILGEYIQANDGTLVADKKIYYGESFNVERRSGVILGGGLGNSSYPKKQVLDFGSKKQAFKALWISQDVVGTDGGKNVVYLTVYEYDEGISKPFLVVAGSRVISGTCE